MKIKVRVKRTMLITADDKPVFAIGTMCGERLFWLRSWQLYPLFWKLKAEDGWGFGVGPVLIWDGK